MYEEEQFQIVYNEFINLANSLAEDVDVLMIAAVMSIIGMSLYRMSLSEDEYNKMVKVMYELKGESKRLDQKEMLH